ncbi:MAG: hypothetical protein ACI8RD_009783, partial [Bacillariaceae sp.]|jgi:hypothetical protein
VTLDDIMDLMGSDAVQGEEALRNMWGDSMKDYNCSAARITYDDFVLIMKGQTRDFEADGPHGNFPRSESGQRLNGALLHAVNEVDEAEINMRVSKTGEPTTDATPQRRRSLKSFSPLTPIVSNIPVNDSPISMDNNDDMPIPLPLQFPMMPSFTPPTTPINNMATNNHIVSSRSDSKINIMAASAVDELLDHMSNPESNNIYPIPNMPKPSVIHVRVKSRSFDERELTSTMVSGWHRAVALPDHDPEPRNSLVNDKTMSALQVNRQLYRSHRQMRLSVIDACKRFEEQQTRHAHGVLLALEKEESIMATAGLVMRRVENKTVSSEEVKILMEKNRKEQQDLMEKANRRSGGRGGRGRRKKTVSDLSAMMGSLSSEEMTKISIQAASKPSNDVVDFVEISNKHAPIPPVIETKPLEDIDVDVDDTDLRSATVPGEFRRVSDPFGSHGKYAAMLMD